MIAKRNILHGEYRWLVSSLRDSRLCILDKIKSNATWLLYWQICLKLGFLIKIHYILKTYELRYQAPFAIHSINFTNFINADVSFLIIIIIIMSTERRPLLNIGLPWSFYLQSSFSYLFKSVLVSHWWLIIKRASKTRAKPSILEEQYIIDISQNLYVYLLHVVNIKV